MSAQMHVAQQTLQRVENMEHNRAFNYEPIPPYPGQWDGYYPIPPPPVPTACPHFSAQQGMICQHPTTPPKVPPPS